jgi:hypothetical protein
MRVPLEIVKQIQPYAVVWSKRAGSPYYFYIPLIYGHESRGDERREAQDEDGVA